MENVDKVTFFEITVDGAVKEVEPLHVFENFIIYLSVKEDQLRIDTIQDNVWTNRFLMTLHLKPGQRVKIMFNKEKDETQ